MTGKIVKHPEYTYQSGGKKVLVPAHTERHPSLCVSDDRQGAPLSGSLTEGATAVSTVT